MVWGRYAVSTVVDEPRAQQEPVYVCGGAEHVQECQGPVAFLESKRFSQILDFWPSMQGCVYRNATFSFPGASDVAGGAGIVRTGGSVCGVDMGDPWATWAGLLQVAG